MKTTTNTDTTKAQKPTDMLLQSVYAFPMSFAQQRLWFLDQFEPGNTLYNIVWPMRLRGRLHVEALEASLNEIVRRHEVLRATFTTINEQPVQVIAPSLRISLQTIDLTALPETEQQAEMQRLATAEAETPISLETGPMLRTAFARLGQEDHLLVLTLHHIVSDRWSRAIFFRELATLYEAFSSSLPSPLPELPLQYTDFSVWQRQWLSGKNLDKQLAYWRQQLAGAPATLELPTDRPRPAQQTFNGRVYPCRIPQDLADNLKAMSRREGVTLFMLLLAALQTLLARYCSQQEVVVGTPIANRNRSEVENLIGFFANTLALRTDLSGDPTFCELLARVREVALGAFAHQDLPFEKLVEELKPERSLSHSPLFQVLFALQNAPTQAVRFPGLTLETVSIQGRGSRFDLTLFLTEAPDGLHGRLEYNTDLFEETTVARMVGHFQQLLEEVVSNPERRIGEIELLTAAERQQMLVEWNNTAVEYPAVCVHELIQRQARTSPESVAVRSGRKSLSYAELNRRANQVARYLRRRGVGPGILVGLYLERSLEMMVALLGVLKAGGAYVPLDPAYPKDRIAFIVEDSQVKVLLTQQPLAGGLPTHTAEVVALDVDWPGISAEPEDEPSSGVKPEDLAYVLYTSGSTGKPKGVQIEHRAVVNFLSSMLRQPGLQASDILLAVTTLSFDIAGLELYLPLTCGAEVVLAGHEQASDGQQLLRLMESSRATAMQATPATWRLLLESGWQGNRKLKVLCGGEALPRELAEQLRPLCGELWNMYGPTETTIWSSLYRVEEANWAVAPIGKPIANTQMYVLDDRKQPVPLGATGELYIGGDGLARGYWQREELTAEKFVENPFRASSRLYRTGDLARYQADGSLQYLGRIDNQVKVRGYRIELGEIEAVLGTHPAVQQAVVVAREDRPGDKRLVAYLIAGRGEPGTREELQNYLKQHLPEYMVPSAFVTLERFPLTPNGKVDRRAMPAPDESQLEAAKAKVAPRNPVEEVIARIWAEILRAEVGVYDDFFDLGGHSLLATRVISRLRQVFQIEIPLRFMFEAPTVAALAKRIEQAPTDKGPGAPPIIAVPRARNLRLSFAQERLWFLDQLEPNNPLFNIPWAFRLSGALQVGALKASLGEIVRRHEVLRTRFATEDNLPVQVILPPGNVELPLTDLSGLREVERDGEARRLILEEGSRPFDLSHDSLLRARLVRLGAEDHILVVNIHHIVSDRWSVGILTNELTTLYQAFAEGKPSPLSDLPFQYADFAVWQREWLQGEVLEQQISYWKNQLRDAPHVLEIPTDQPRPPKESFRGDIEGIPVSAALTEKLKTLARREGVTLFMTLLAAWDVLLARYSGQEDIVVGTPIANRNRSEIEGLIGYFANTLALRCDLSGDPTFRELLGRVRETALGAYAHQDLPFEKLVEELRPERSLSHNPLFQVLFALQNTPDLDQQIPGLKLRAVGTKVGSAKCDLALFMAETADGMMGRLEYSTDIFEQSTIVRLVGHFQNLLDAIVAHPEQHLSELPLLSQPERQQLLVEWNATQAHYPRTQCLHQLFEAQAKRTPNTVAVACQDQSLTYSQLNEQANRLAHYLEQRGLGPGRLVGVHLERSLDLMVALLAVQKVGAAYVPLDPAYPTERLRFMLDDAQVALLLTQQSLLSALPPHDAELLCLDRDQEQWANESSANPTSTTTPEDLIYVIFTSGSTGKPKGVEVPHRAVVNLLTAMGRQLSMNENDVLVALASFAFDMSIPELYLPLVTGGKVVLGQRELASDGEALAALLNQVGATLIHATPTTWRLLLEAGYSGAGRKRVVGAEALPRDLCTRLLQADPSLYNFYGPTETTVWSTCHHFVSVDEPLTVGRPLPNTQVYILDAEQQPVPIGVAGELYIGGDGVTKGYRNQPELTAERFVADSFSANPSARLYRTGDRARYLADGRIEFLGRIDNQVKVRGFRIELGEIESVLSAHPGVQQAVVTVREDTPGDQRLVAYLVPARESSPAVEELRNLVASRLPDYMTPAAFVLLEKIPLSPNGKVDRKALPAPELTRLSAGDAYVAPRDAVEEAVAEIWAEVLRTGQVGVHDDFFALGGHSLLATQVISRIRQVLLVELPLRMIFESPTVAEMAERIQSARLAQEGLSTPPITSVAGGQELPLSFAQQRLWLLERLGDTGGAYNIPVTIQVSGKLDASILEQSASEIVRRHQVLRSVFAFQDGAPVQIISPLVDVKIPVTDLSRLPQDEREARALELAGEEAQRPFDLQQGPLYRISLLRLGEEDHVLLVTVHHIVFDGWSIGIFLNELTAAYQDISCGKTPILPPLPIQYADFAVWQRQYLQGDPLERQIAYWKHTMKDAPASLDLPTDRPRPPTQTFRGAKESLVISKQIVAALKKLGQREGVTFFMTLLAALNVLLSRYSGQDDIVVGSPIAGRNHAELERLIGFFVNTLVLRTRLWGDLTFRELLESVREAALGAYAHQDVPFEKLVEELRPQRDLSRNPLFQVMFILHNQPNGSKEVPGLVLKPFHKNSATAMFDLTVIANETPEGLKTTFNYNADLFDAATMARMLAHLETLLESIAANPEQHLSQLSLPAAEERHQLLVEWNQTAAEYPAVCIHQLFEEQARRTPTAVAASFGKQSLTYADLERRANRLAHYLAKLGVGSETLVGICVERSLDMMVALLGVLKAGAAYVPLDPAYPKERLGFILEDANITLLLTQQPLVKSLPEHGARTVCLDSDWPAIAAEPGEHLPVNVRPENLAYVLYTSGSTGKPKGVEIEHRNVVNFLASMQREPGMRADDVLLAVTTLSFDIAGLELYLPLTVGAKVIIASREETYDGHQLRTLLGECGATVMQATPATWRLLLESGWTGDPKLRVLCGGEALPRELAERLRSCCAELWNMYGPTETTIWSSLCKVDSNSTSSVPLGWPIANTTMYVLDERQQPVPVGVAGELYIGGHGVARGYYRRPELTAERFLPDPFCAQPGARLYRTGDLVKHLTDGSLVFLGRTDFQVKLRGFRIELGEIESVISEHGEVQQSVAVVREDERGNQRLVAYVVPAQNLAGDTSNLILKLKQNLKNRLPDYMLPSAFVALEGLPLTPNGKVDRHALPVPEAVRTEKVAAPRDDIENLLLQIWREVLGVETAGVTDDFFDLGGHSLLAVRLITEIEKATGKQIPLATLFRGATVEYLASVLREGVTPAHPMVAEVRGSGHQPPFFGIVTPGMNPLGYAALARHLGKDQPVYRIQGPGARLRNRPYTAAEFVNLAADYIKAMKTIQPEGPYYFGGMCEGARIAFDMARLLEAQGEQVGLLAIFDTWVIENSQIRLLWKADYYSGRLRQFWRLSLTDKWKMTRQWMRRGDSDSNDPQGLWPAAYWPGKNFVPATFGGKITVFKVPQQPYFYVRDPLMGWGSRTTGGVELHLVRLNTRKHILIFRDPYVRDLAQKLGNCLARAREQVHNATGATRAVWVPPEGPLPSEAKEEALGTER